MSEYVSFAPICVAGNSRAERDSMSAAVEVLWRGSVRFHT
jgi:hypothetical protein